MLKYVNVIFGMVFVVTLLFVGGCQKDTDVVNPSTDTFNAPLEEFDMTFPDTFAEQFVEPTVPQMDVMHYNRFLRFLARYLELTEGQLEGLKNIYKDYYACLRQVRQDVKDGKLTTREEVRLAIKACRTAYHEDWKTWVGTLSDGQKTKLARLWRIIHRRPVAPITDYLVDECAIDIPYNDMMLEKFENDMVFASDAITMHKDPKGPRGFIGFLIKYLKLDDTQIAILKSALAAYREDLKDIFTDLKNGEITRAEAKAAIIAAHKEMMNTIYNSLDEDQKAKWNKIFRRHKK